MSLALGAKSRWRGRRLDKSMFSKALTKPTSREDVVGGYSRRKMCGLWLHYQSHPGETVSKLCNLRKLFSAVSPSSISGKVCPLLWCLIYNSYYLVSIEAVSPSKNTIHCTRRALSLVQPQECASKILELGY